MIIGYNEESKQLCLFIIDLGGVSNDLSISGGYTEYYFISPNHPNYNSIKYNQKRIIRFENNVERVKNELFCVFVSILDIMNIVRHNNVKELQSELRESLHKCI